MSGARGYVSADIYTRIMGLMRAQAIKIKSRPVWVDVWHNFPPVTPVISMPNEKPSPPDGSPMHRLIQVPEVTRRPLYFPEDILRAEFYRTFDISHELYDCINPAVDKPSLCELVVTKTKLLLNTKDSPNDMSLLTPESKQLWLPLFEEAIEILKDEGYKFVYKKPGDNKQSKAKFSYTLIKKFDKLAGQKLSEKYQETKNQ